MHVAMDRKTFFFFPPLHCPDVPFEELANLLPGVQSPLRTFRGAREFLFRIFHRDHLPERRRDLPVGLCQRAALRARETGIP